MSSEVVEEVSGVVHEQVKCPRVKFRYLRDPRTEGTVVTVCTWVFEGVLYYGLAYCHAYDQFTKEKAHRITLGRMRKAYLSAFPLVSDPAKQAPNVFQTRRNIWDGEEFGFVMSGLSKQAFPPALEPFIHMLERGPDGDKSFDTFELVGNNGDYMEYYDSAVSVPMFGYMPLPNLPTDAMEDDATTEGDTVQ